MKFELKIKCDNAAFQDGACSDEIARILRKMAEKIEAYGPTEIVAGRVLDSNGNVVGNYIRS